MSRRKNINEISIGERCIKQPKAKILFYFLDASISFIKKIPYSSAKYYSKAMRTRVKAHFFI